MTHGWALWGPGRQRRPTDDAKEPIIMTAITTIRLNKWERAETSSHSDQIGPNEIKMPINPVLIAAARSRKNTEICTCKCETGPAAAPSRIQTAKC